MRGLLGCGSLLVSCFGGYSFSCAEVPYAQPPARFQDPVPLPEDWQYENKEYTSEASCTSSIRFTSARDETDRNVLDAAQPKNDGQAAGTHVDRLKLSSLDERHKVFAGRTKLVSASRQRTRKSASILSSACGLNTRSQALREYRDATNVSQGIRLSRQSVHSWRVSTSCLLSLKLL